MVYYGGKNSANPVEDKMIRQLDKKYLIKDYIQMVRGENTTKIELPEYGEVNFVIKDGMISDCKVSSNRKFYN